MSFKLTMAVLLCLTGIAVAEPTDNTPTNTTSPTEQEAINKYLQKTEKKHMSKIGWATANFGLNRINRHNDYNGLANVVNGSLTGGEMSWLNTAQSFGAEVGMILSKQIGWSIGGEYWMKMGQNESGSYQYSASGSPVTISTLKSEISVYGFSTGVSYYFLNPPKISAEPARDLSVYANGTVGYYHVSWDMFDEYQNLNLSTSTSEGENATYTGSAPGFSFNLGVEYPLSFGGMTFGAKAGYFHLNFGNVSWYNSQDQEVVASYDGTEAGRVNLDFSGVRGNIEIKKFFSW